MTERQKRRRAVLEGSAHIRQPLVSGEPAAFADASLRIESEARDDCLIEAQSVHVLA